MGKLAVVCAVGAGVLLAGCQAVNTTSGGAVGIERKQYMFSMLSAQEVDSMYAQAYQQTLSQAASQGVLDKSSRNAQRVQTIARRLIAQAPVFRADAAQWNWQAFWLMTAFLSVILAFMNILPIPALDGGHVLFLVYEVIVRRKPNEKFMEYAQVAGMIFLLGLVLYANGMDIVRAIFN